MVKAVPRKYSESVAYDAPYKQRNTTINPFTKGNITMVNTAEILDGLDSIVQGAADWPEDLGKGNINRGGMVISKSTYDVCAQHYVRKDAGGTLYEGPLAIVGGDTTGLPVMASLDSRLTRMSLGSTAIARTLPTNPSTDLANTLGELRADGLPRIPGATALKRPSASSVGDEYLNYVFGISPLASDLRSLASTIKNSRVILEQFRRDSLKKIRRRYYFPAESSTQIFPNRKVYFGGQQGSPPNGTISIRSEKKTWFSGAYRYYIPYSTQLWDRVNRWESEANRLLGLRLTPSLVWELSPFSWAADWVTNTGDLMNNISALSNDSMVLQYGFLMQSITYEVTYSYTAPLSWGLGVVKNMSPYTRVTHEVKSRIPATPYGFGVDLSGLTDRQWSILGALGISRSPGSLARR